MATAVQIAAFERANLDWIILEDDAGRKWRYERRGEAHPRATLHVHCQYFGGPQKRVALVRDGRDRPLAHQDGPGLPQTIAVEYIQGEASGRAASMTKHTYELVGEQVGTEH